MIEPISQNLKCVLGHARDVRVEWEKPSDPAVVVLDASHMPGSGWLAEIILQGFTQPAESGELGATIKCDAAP